MSWLVIARKEFADARRARILWGLVGVIGVLTGTIALATRFIPGLEPDPVTALGAATEFAAMLVPILALVAAYLAIAGERESGSVKVLLGLPPSRGEVLLGKFLGRGAVVALGVGLGFAVAGLVTVVSYSAAPVGAVASTVLLTAGLGVVFVGVAVGLSAASATRARAMTLSIAVYLVLVLLWDLLPQGLYLAVYGSSPSGPLPAWFLGLQVLSPPGAYSALVASALSAGGPVLAEQVAGPTPFFLEAPFLVGLLLAWAVVPLAVGCRLFGRADL